MIPLCNCSVCHGGLIQPKCRNTRENRVAPTVNVGETLDTIHVEHQRRVLLNRVRIHRALTRAGYYSDLGPRLRFGVGMIKRIIEKLRTIVAPHFCDRGFHQLRWSHLLGVYFCADCNRLWYPHEL